jgi:alpha-1,3-glucan synthase
MMAAITTPIALLMFAIAGGLFVGLPDFYRQAPGKIKSFYMSIFRRKIIGWFFITVIIQNYFLSAPYGRNWAYLWSSTACPPYVIVLLVILFFVILWAGVLWIFAALSKDHSPSSPSVLVRHVGARCSGELQAMASTFHGLAGP